ncbi:hypothetical protein EDB92DRAFT_110508 [Lactarius akahatsu]|uniref:Secreted protein n=1 Tax=Lactarius akahatsu TaxID=416441 RepID=A0AAD4QFS1_9AGAM|nr:hypothetical protein EDB92DRAFT_110508 [Lactarius akahatsu]
MHKSIDLLFTVAFVVGSVLLVALLVRKCSAAVDATKCSLEKRGWKVSSHSLSVPASKRATLLNRERYLDATQRGLSKAAHASTFGTGSELHSRTSADRLRGSDISGEERKHRLHLFKRHRNMD